MIAVGINEEQESVEILFDEDGIDHLIKILTRLKVKTTHEHLMTPFWGATN